MSHFTRVRTALKDAELLVEALATRGFDTVEVHQEPETLYGYEGDARPERAEVIVRREHIGALSNDIGFAMQQDGSFQAIISEYDRSVYDEGWLTGLTQAYGHAAALRYADRQGLTIVEDETTDDGTRRLTLRRH